MERVRKAMWFRSATSIGAAPHRIQHICADAINKFAKSHLSKVTSHKLFKDGERVTVHCYVNDDHMTFDPPMHSVRSVASQDSNGGMGLELFTNGKDSLGSFSLDGAYLQNGKLILTRRYSGGPTWR